jgi:hypothetical protein
MERGAEYFTQRTLLSHVLGVRHSGQTSKLVRLFLSLCALLNLSPLYAAGPSGCLLGLGSMGGIRSRTGLAAAIRRTAGLAARLSALVRAALGGGCEALRCGPRGRRRGCVGEGGGAVGGPGQFGGEHRK